MLTTPIEQLAEHWRFIAPVARIPANESEYRETVALLDRLIDMTDGDEDHPLAGLVDLIGNAVADYEQQHESPIMAKGIDVLKLLIDQHGLVYEDLRNEIGTPGVVGDILKGRRQLNARQIDALAKRFGVPHTVFFNDE